MIKFYCQYCGAKISAEQSDAGAAANCPTCGQDLVVPVVSSEPVGESVSIDPPEEAQSSDKDSGDFEEQAEKGVESAARQPFGTRLKSFAKDGWSGLQTQSKQIALKAEIEKLRNVNLRKARRALGEKCFDANFFSEKLGEQHQAIRDVDSVISLNREFNDAEAEQTKLASLQRKGKQVVMAGQAQALLLKRQRLLAELGTTVFLLPESEAVSAITAERDAIKELEQRIRDKVHELRVHSEEAHGKSRVPMMALAAVLICLASIIGIIGINTLAGDGKSAPARSASSSEYTYRVVTSHEKSNSPNDSDLIEAGFTEKQIRDLKRTAENTGNSWDEVRMLLLKQMYKEEYRDVEREKRRELFR